MLRVGFDDRKTCNCFSVQSCRSNRLEQVARKLRVIHFLVRNLRGLFCVLLLGAALAAQKGSAPNGYYPAGYGGSTFTGKVVQTTDRTITLNYIHGSKTDVFEAYATAPCNVPSSATTTIPMPLSSVQIGAVVTVFYEGKTTKGGGHKEKKNQVIAISVLEEDGKKIPEARRAIFYCVTTPKLDFMAFPQGWPGTADR